MKTLQKLVAALFFFAISTNINAQTQISSRPALFSKIAKRLPAPVSELDKAFNAAEGSLIKMRMNELVFEGKVTSSIKRYDNLYTVIIKSSSEKNTVFSISKRINDDKTVTYMGRIINEEYADGFELVQEEKGRYAMSKIQTEELLQDY